MKGKSSPVPPTTIERLPLYLRCLLQAQSMRMPLINSQQLAEMCGTNAAQVRKDMSYLGELGTRGLGYDVEELILHISRVLGVTERRKVAIFGFGKLGSALVAYSGFHERGFEVVAVFDVDPDKIGRSVGGVTVTSSADAVTVLRERGVEIVIIATPPESAQEAADAAVAAGIKAILNLAPTNLVVPDAVVVRQLCTSTELQILSFHLARSEEATE